jgi:hypothetical protein
MENLHGRIVVRIGTRCFAVRKEPVVSMRNGKKYNGYADQMHAATQLSSTWARQMTKPAARCIRTRSIKA